MKDESLESPLLADDYLVLPCPACGRSVKIPTDSLGLRMGCTYCREPLEVAEYEPAVEEIVGGQKPEGDEQKKKGKEKEKSAAKTAPGNGGVAPAAQRQPLAFRLLRDEDLGVDFNRDFADEFERRRLPTDAPAWDDERLLQRQREREESLSRTDAHEAPPKRLLTRKEYIFRTITITIMSASAVVAAVIVYIGIVKMTSVVQTDGKTLRELPAEVRGKIEAAVAEQQEKPISEFLTSKEEEAAVAIVNGFLQAKSNDERLAFVRDPDRVAPLMEEFYRRGEMATEWPEGRAVLRDKLVDKDRYFIRLALEFIGRGHRIFVIEQTKDAFKLDWETAVGYQQMPLAEFKAQRPTTPTPFRVKLNLSDYYNYRFDNQTDYQAVDLSYPGNKAFRFTGYIDRKRDWAAALIEKLESGLAPSVIAELRFPEADGEIEDENQVEIISIISDTWWL